VESLRSIDKAIEILFHLNSEPAGSGVTAIGRALGMPKSSVHRLLSALGRRELVERDERGRYRPGLGLMALGLGALEREPVVAAARPLLEAEAEALGETVFLVGARAGRLLVLDKAEGSGFLRAAPRVGGEVPVHATAVGKLFLAFGGDLLAQPSGALERFTGNTVASRAELDREVARARQRGFAENREEWIPGLAVVAAPVLARGRMKGAIALAATLARLDALGCDERAARVVRAARRVSTSLEGLDEPEVRRR
jgi:DNA-binding IclR family transcriptional regulator